MKHDSFRKKGLEIMSTMKGPVVLQDGFAFPSSGRDAAEFRELPGRACELQLKGETLEGDQVTCRIQFSGVEAYRCTYLPLLTAEMSRLAYDRLVDLGKSSWLQTCVEHRSSDSRLVATSSLRHLMVCLDDGPCYELVCVNWDYTEVIT